jgi:DNA ligase 1
MPVLLSRLVAVSAAVAATRSRSRKIATMADALAELGPEELDAGVAFLSGEPRQDRLDLGPAAVHGIVTAPAPTSSLTVGEVDDTLQAIADVPPGTGSRTRRLELLSDLLARATDDEQRFLRGLVLREPRQGALAGVLSQAIARAAEVDEAAVRRAAMLSGDLRLTARAAMEQGAAGLTAFRLTVGTPLQPMLAQTATSVTDAVGELGEVVVEAKIDGARVQVHRDGDDVAVFTRNLNDVSHRVPEVVAAALALPVRTVVLDGEAIALTAAGRPRPFQETMQRFGRERDLDEVRGTVPLSVRFFDVLHLDGEDVLDLPLSSRLEGLRAAVPDGARVDQLVTDDADAATAFLRATLQAGHEGVMVKDLDAPYEAGRRGAGWRKVKPVHTLDLVVLAAEWGSGRRRGWLSNLHLGCRADDGDGFVMLGKTFKGLTDELLTWQTAELLARETRREGHVVHVRPELVVEIALDGLVRSPRYPGGLALRFARVRGYRPDKAPHEADTLATVRALHAGDLPPPI